MKKVHVPAPIAWTDEDGDKAELTADPEEIGGTGALGVIGIIDAEDGHECAVYVDEENAQEIIAWLTERLQTVARDV